MRGPVQGQGHGKRCALSFLAFRAERTAVALGDDVVTQRQAQARALTRGLSREKGVLVTTGRKITLSPKSLFVSTFCRRIEKRSFYKASMEQVKSGLYGPPMRLFVLSH